MRAGSFGSDPAPSEGAAFRGATYIRRARPSPLPTPIPNSHHPLPLSGLVPVPVCTYDGHRPCAGAVRAGRAVRLRWWWGCACHAYPTEATAGSRAYMPVYVCMCMYPVPVSYTYTIRPNPIRTRSRHREHRIRYRIRIRIRFRCSSPVPNPCRGRKCANVTLCMAQSGPYRTAAHVIIGFTYMARALHSVWHDRTKHRPLESTNRPVHRLLELLPVLRRPRP